MTTSERHPQAGRRLADRIRFSLPDEARDLFLEILDRPVKPISEKPELEALLWRRSVLEQGSAES